MATSIPYESTADAVALVRRGGGSLVASLFGSDTTDIGALVTGIASHHGRVLVMNEQAAAGSTGHGSPLPHLTHGGPGRAGGGQELGGTRSVRTTQLDGRGYGEVAWDTHVINHSGAVAAAYDVLAMVANRPGLNGAPE